MQLATQIGAKYYIVPFGINNHFILGVVDFTQHPIHMYTLDSLRGRRSSTSTESLLFEVLLQALPANLRGGTQHSPLACVQQPDMHNCGVFVIHYIHVLLVMLNSENQVIDWSFVPQLTQFVADDVYQSFNPALYRRRIARHARDNADAHVKSLLVL